MTTWNLQNLRERTAKILGLPLSGLDTSEINNYVNEAYRTTLPLDLYPPELKTYFTTDTISDMGDYGLDTDMLAIIGPSFIDNELFDKVTHDHRWFYQYVNGDRTQYKSGKPRIMLIFGNMIQLFPIPDDAYTIKTTALSRPDALANDGSEIFDPLWGLSIVYAAGSQYSSDIGDMETSNQLLAKYRQNKVLALRQQLLTLSDYRATSEL